MITAFVFSNQTDEFFNLFVLSFISKFIAKHPQVSEVYNLSDILLPRIVQFGDFHIKVTLLYRIYWINHGCGRCLSGFLLTNNSILLA